MFRLIAYIDGFNLYYGLRESNWRRYYWLDVSALVRRIVKADQDVVAVKYFTSRVSSTASDPDKARRQEAYIEALQAQSRVEVFYGHYLQKPMTCRQCGCSWTVREEKRTDVNIAVEMMTDALQDHYDVAMLITGDSDLSGVIERLRILYRDKRIVVVFPPLRVSKRLRQVASAYFDIRRPILAKCQLPDAVEKPDGHVLRRPDSWR